MKRLIFALLLVAGTLVATTSDAQVFRGRIGYGFRHRVFVAPRVILPVPAPYYDGGAEIAPPVYGYGYRPAYGYGYRHFDRDFYHERRFGYRRR